MTVWFQTNGPQFPDDRGAETVEDRRSSLHLSGSLAPVAPEVDQFGHHVWNLLAIHTSSGQLKSGLTKCKQVFGGGLRFHCLRFQAVAVPGLGVKSVAAFAAGCTEATLAPFERVQVLMQESKFHSQFKNTPSAFM